VRSSPDDGPLRALTPADVAAVAELEREIFAVSAWTAAMVREEITGPGRWYVGLPDEVGHLLAYAGAWFDGDVVQVMTLGVAPRARGAGLGRRLLEALVCHARDVGARAVLLEVRVDNEPAIGLYERAGFVTLGRRRRYYQPEDVDAWTMRLPLAPPTAGPT